MRLYLLQGSPIKLDDLIYASRDQGMIVVAVECKALSHTLVVRRQAGPEPVYCNLIAVIKILQHTNDLPDSRYVLVLLFDVRMQVVILEVGVSEVDAQDEMESRPVGNIGQKGIAVYLLPFHESDKANHEAILVHPLMVLLVLLV